jgi:hypothetical protein
MSNEKIREAVDETKSAVKSFFRMNGVEGEVDISELQLTVACNLSVVLDARFLSCYTIPPDVKELIIHVDNLSKGNILIYFLDGAGVRYGEMLKTSNMAGLNRHLSAMFPRSGGGSCVPGSGMMSKEHIRQNVDETRAAVKSFFRMNGVEGEVDISELQFTVACNLSVVLDARFLSCYTIPPDVKKLHIYVDNLGDGDVWIYFSDGADKRYGEMLRTSNMAGLNRHLSAMFPRIMSGGVSVMEKLAEMGAKIDRILAFVGK